VWPRIDGTWPTVVFIILLLTLELGWSRRKRRRRSALERRR